MIEKEFGHLFNQKNQEVINKEVMRIKKDAEFHINEVTHKSNTQIIELRKEIKELTERLEATFRTETYNQDQYNAAFEKAKDGF